MQHQSLFGHVATLFSTHPENLATESLNFILNRSIVAERAFLDYIRQLDIALPETLSFRTQMGGKDNAIPDLVGVDADGQQVIIVEAKFWAGLTNNQPVTYLKRLPPQDSILLFIAPAMRFSTLWSELVRRCQESDLSIVEERPLGGEFLAAKTVTSHVLALTSWRSILAFIRRTLEAAGEIEAASDVAQLQGLCQRMDDNAFLPLRSEELTANIGRRVYQFCQLVNDVTNMALSEGLASTEGLRATGGFGWYGRYMKLFDIPCLLKFDANLWARYRETPIWLRVYGKDWKFSQSIKDALAQLELADPVRLILVNDELVVPMCIPIGVEKNQVVAELMTQFREVANLLRSHHPSP
ncbi:MAG: hypothetical protein AB1791_02720 [Chloroflexota bacterium]